MSTENSNPAAASALLLADEANNLKDYINSRIVFNGKEILSDTFEMKSVMYARKIQTVGCLLAYDQEVRNLARRAGIDLDKFDAMIEITQQAIVAHTSKIDPIGSKVFKIVRDLYANGNHQ